MEKQATAILWWSTAVADNGHTLYASLCS